MPEPWTPADTSTFILRFGPVRGAPGLRVAVKDLIDMAGVPTTAGSRVVADRAAPAPADAVCLAGTRAAEAAGSARIVGKTNLNELAYGVTGLNPWFGTPANPLDAARVPGGSSSGSAVAVGAGDADVAFGSDTGGSIRIPAACCGVAGLKTTAGRVSLGGVWALAPSLDTVGPMARDTAGLVAGMRLLEPGFEPASSPPARIGRVRLPATIEVDPDVDAAVDAVLAASGVDVVPVDVPGWHHATDAGMTVLAYEAWQTDGPLRPSGGLSAEVAARLDAGAGVDAARADAARRAGAAWAASELLPALARTPVVALPTLRALPPHLDEAARMMHLRLTMPANVAGVPALALPVPTEAGFPASLQLLASPGGEELLLATAAAIEASSGAPGPTMPASCR